jgi:hypothetical protein
LLFSLYVAPIADTLARFNVSHAQYADDTQLYVALKNESASTSRNDCFEAVHGF